MKIFFLLNLLSFLIFPSAQAAETIFEGFYRLENQDRHVGFAVQRLESNSGQGRQTLKYFISTEDRDGRPRQIKATVTYGDDLRPIEYHYLGDDSGTLTRLHGLFEGDVFREEFKRKDLKGSQAEKMEPNVFFSAMVNAVLLANSPVKGKVYKYKAVKEQEAAAFGGQVRVVDIKTVKGIKVYRLFDDFENNPLETWLTESGQAVRMNVPDRGVTSTLVEDSKSAIGELKYDKEALIDWFGYIPTGGKNVVALKQVAGLDKLFTTKLDTKFKTVKEALPLILPKNKIKPSGKSAKKK